MLSDAIRTLSERFRAGVKNDDPRGLFLTLRAFELEARNMENRLEQLTHCPHVPLDGHLVSFGGKGEQHA
ncbi:hypothetical protein [Rhizobium sp. 11_C7_N12_5]|uniref:hypothetical protein n=1 Tax=Rhizobium sp. 11_C7_N12_5 TaxID=3240770 RepID=UPI003F1EB3C2